MIASELRRANSMASAKTQPARGMRDFLPADVRKREYVIGVIKEVYERYGFEPLETPAVENIETLMGKYGEEGNQLIFKILKRGEHEKTGQADLALRYDLTVPLARVVAQYQNELPKFFKRYQIQPVWRADRPARGRFREFYQCDVDVLGSKSMVVEAEVIAAVADVMKELGFDDFTVLLNHRSVLESMLEIEPKERRIDALMTLDKLDKIGLDGVLKEFDAKGMLELGKAIVELFRGLESVFLGRASEEDWNITTLKFMENWVANHEVGKKGIDELRSIMRLTRESSAGPYMKIAPSLARGLSYYTGAIFEVTVPYLSGSLGGGGRYDNLVGMFLGKDIPACGFSLGLERIIVVMTERNMFPVELVSSPADVMVTIWNEDSVSESLALASELRAQGLRVDIYPETDKMGKQFKYASARGIPFVLILGDDERAHGEVAIKNMKTGEQLRLPFGPLKTSPDQNVQLTDDQTAKSKRNVEALFRWLRNEPKTGEAGGSIKPGA
jgi:histidyl-tRNA synthetase